MDDSKKLGDYGEAAFMADMTEMGWNILNTDQINDRLDKVDVQCFHIDKDTGDIELMQVDTKCTKHPRTPELCFKSKYRNFMVEWRSGTSNGGTPLSDSAAKTTHYAYMMRNGAENAGGYHMPFMLVSVKDIQAFVKAHKDDPTKVQLYQDHAYNVVMTEFMKEYGFEFYFFDKVKSVWGCRQYGNGASHYIMANADGNDFFIETMSKLNLSDRVFLADHPAAEFHAHKQADMKATADKMKRGCFAGDTAKLNKHITDEVRKHHVFDEEYKPTKKEK